MTQHAFDQVLADTRFWATQARQLYCLAHGCGPWHELTDARRASIDAEFERERLNQSVARTLARRGPVDVDPQPAAYTEPA